MENFQNQNSICQLKMVSSSGLPAPAALLDQNALWQFERLVHNMPWGFWDDNLCFFLALLRMENGEVVVDVDIEVRPGLTREEAPEILSLKGWSATSPTLAVDLHQEAVAFRQSLATKASGSKAA